MTSVRRARSRIAAFQYAFSGWWFVLRTQRNAWIHMVASGAAFGFATWLRLNPLEWAILLLAVGLVWMAEFVNTALEAVVDLTTPDIHPLAQVGKDVGAAAVLIAALTAALIGLLLMAPPLLAKLIPPG